MKETTENTEKYFEEIRDYLLAGDAANVAKLVNLCLDKDIPVKDILNKALKAGMDIVGKKFKSNQIYIPEVLISAKAMQKGFNILGPYLIKAGVKSTGRIVIGTVKGDLHDIGKNLVAMMLKGAGFEVIDLGIDVAPERFVDIAQETGAEVIAMSSLLTTTLSSMKDTIVILSQRDLQTKIKTLIGGAPVTEEFAKNICADGYGENASTAVDVAKELIGLNINK